MLYLFKKFITTFFNKEVENGNTKLTITWNTVEIPQELETILENPN